MKRLAIRAYLDARPGATVADLAALFSTSNSVVCAARRKPVDHWAARLASAPKPSTRRAWLSTPIPTPTPPPSTIITKPAPTPPLVRARPGSRERVVLDEPEPLLEIPDVVDIDTDPDPTVDVDTPGDIEVPDVKIKNEFSQRDP